MSIDDKEFHLPREQRTQNRSDWFQEARRRADQLDNGSVEAVPSDKVMMEARARIK